MLTLRNGARSLQPSLYSLTRTLHVASTTTIPRRFLPSRLEGIEDVEDYQLGGFHPVSIGDCFAQKRYRVVRKLGYGGSSTVWLARDQEGPGRLVTLKVMRADASSARTSEIPALVIPKCFEHPFCILFISRPLMIISSTKVRMALTCSLSFHSLALAFLLCRTVQDEQSGAGGCVRTWHAR